MMNFRTYAKRQLNPFEGVLQVIEADQARAFSVNGVVWQIQIQAISPDHTWRSSIAKSAIQHATQHYFNWGVWHSTNGMQHVNANPILDLGAMTAASEQLIAALQHTPPPYELTDHYEYWACDLHNQPIALLASNWIKPSNQPAIEARHWRAAQPNRTNESNDDTYAALIENHIQQNTRQRCWFKRLQDNSGIRLDNQQKYPANAFPDLLIRENWPEKPLKPAMKNYIARLAPLLLTLPLADSTRSELEVIACQQNALLVADLHRVYPASINSTLIEQARVEAKLRRSSHVA